MDTDTLSTEQWKEVVRRLCIIADWGDLSRPSSAGADGIDWCSDSEKFDPEAAAIAVLDDEQVFRVNDSYDEDSWVMKQLIRKGILRES